MEWHGESFGCGVGLGTPFPEKCVKINVFWCVWELGRVLARMKAMNTMKRIGHKCNMAGSSDPGFFVPEVRMTVVRLYQLPQIKQCFSLRLLALVLGPGRDP